MAYVFLWSGLAAPAFAIPSPELVIGSVSSIGQILALGVAGLGGGAAVLRGRRSRAGGWILVGLALALIVSLSANLWQVMDRKQDRLAHLQSTLLRPAQFDGTKIQDETLVETSFTAQQSSKLSMDTQAAMAALDDTDTVFVDVRETGEHAMGTLPGAQHLRFPDLMADPGLVAGKKLVLFCHNGNRSSESCARLAALGIDCRFIAGGIEKWIVEGRPFSDAQVRGLSDLRALPDYTNRTVLLDTAQVHNLVASEPVQFLDTRYPGDFATGHLPGAINIPLRAMETTDLQAALSDLPDRPLVAACYDRRSCFMAEVLGLELAARGADYRGRYTVPWEYFIAPPPKPHVAAWMADQQQSWWQWLVGGLATAMLWLNQSMPIVVVVAGLAVLSRVLVLPFAIKAERDQLAMADLRPKLALLKSKLKDDPQRLRRALGQFYRGNGLTPVRNLVVLLFLPLMMLGLAAVERIAAQVPGDPAWGGVWGAADATFLLQAGFAAMGAWYLVLALGRGPRQRVILGVLGAVGLFALSLPFSALGTFYLCFAMILLLAQRAVITGQVTRVWRAVRAQFFDSRFAQGRAPIPLTRPDLLVDCGNKALRLAELKAVGIPVPDGVVLNTRFLNKYAQLPRDAQQELCEQLWSQLGFDQVAVRSSCSAEDGQNHSFAGVFESVLHVSSSGLKPALDHVIGSFEDARVLAYAEEQGAAGGGNILIQEMTQPEHAGVLFTRDPNGPGAMLCEYVQGTADDLVSGRVSPTAVRLHRISGEVMGEDTPPLDLPRLHQIGLLAERQFGGPQDIEWVSCGGEIKIVQCRAITAQSGGDAEDLARKTHFTELLDRFAEVDAADAIVLEQDEMSEVMPRPTPLSLSYMQRIWAPGGSVDQAARAFGIVYEPPEDAPPHLTNVFGRLYSDRLVKSDANIVIPARAAKRMMRQAATLEKTFWDDFFPDFTRRMALAEAVRAENLRTEMLYDQLCLQFDDYISRTQVEVEKINIMAQFCVTRAQELAKGEDLDLQSLLSVPVHYSPVGLVQHAIALPDAERSGWFAEQMGHRALFDYELSEPRYAEMPETLDALLRPAIIPQPPAETVRFEAEEDTPQTKAVVDARRYQALKEEAKHHCLRQLAVIRRLMVALDQRLGADGALFYLSLDELTEGGCPDEARLAVARSRRKIARRLNAAPTLPARLTLADLERASCQLGAQGANGAVTWVSGGAQVTGRAFIASPKQEATGAPLKGFVPGDILICDMVHPNWLPHVLSAGAVASNVGGWLSHIAIVAREHQIPMAVGVNPPQGLQSGQQVQLGDAGLRPATDGADAAPNAGV